MESDEINIKAKNDLIIILIYLKLRKIEIVINSNLT